MATLSILAAREELVQIGGGLDAREQPLRRLYALPHVVQWLEGVLPTLQAFSPTAILTPLEQLDDLFHDFVSGADFSYYERSHSMTPINSGIWELKTEDLRLFGWFHLRNAFIIGNIDTMDRVKTHGLYAGYRSDCERRRDALDLDLPKFIVGLYSDVL